MECPECKWVNSPDQRFCMRCGLFLLQAGTGAYVASYGRRAAALVLEFGLVIALMAVATVADVALGTSPLVMGLAMLGYIGWSVVLMSRGRTPGKQLLGIYVMNGQAQPIGFWHYALLRSVVGQSVLGGITLGVYAIIDYLWPLWDRNNQTLHDKVASTHVVWQRPG